MRTQLLPFQRSINVPPSESPTATQLVVLGHDTPNSSLGIEAGGCGVSITDHAGVAAPERATPTAPEATRPTDSTKIR